MVHHVKDLSPDQRVAIENLLGRTLRDEESLCRVVTTATARFAGIRIISICWLIA